MRILILSPFFSSKKIAKLLEPFVSSRVANVIPIEMYGELVYEHFKDKTSDGRIDHILRVAGDLESLNLIFSKSETEYKHTIILGPLTKDYKVDKIIAFHDLVLEAQENLCDISAEYKDKFYLVEDADFYSDSPEDLLYKIDLCLKNKIEERILH